MQGKAIIIDKARKFKAIQYQAKHGKTISGKEIPGNFMKGNPT